MTGRLERIRLAIERAELTREHRQQAAARARGFKGPKSKDEKRTGRPYYTTEEERAIIERGARRLGMLPGAFVRRAALEVAAAIEVEVQLLLEGEHNEAPQ